MEKYSLPKRKKYVVLILSIAVHLALFFLIFIYNVEQWHKEQKGLYKQLDQDDDYLVQHILSSGQQQPAQVLFQDDQPSGDSSNLQVDDFVNPFAEDEDDKMTEEAALEPDDDITPPEPEPPKEKAEPSKEQTALATLPDRPKETPPKPRKQKKKPRKKRKTTNQQQFTLADFSRGFIKSMQQEGGYNSTHVQDMRQLALQIYSTKVWNLIKNAFLAGETSLHLSRPVDARTVLALTIDRDGHLVDICLHYQRHISELRPIERLIISKAKTVGLFPPLPQQVKSATKTLSFPLHIQGEAGFHTYSLSYR